jgi:hypothetical protein
MKMESELENLVKKEQELFYRAKAEQFEPDKRKFIQQRTEVLKKIEDIRAKRDAEKKKCEEEQKNEYIRDNLRDFRVIVGTEAEHVMRGEFSLDAVSLVTPQSTEFEIMAVSGHKLKIDLKKLISPSSLNTLNAKTFSPIYLIAEPSGAYQKNKRLGIWNNSGDWAASQGIEYKPQTIIAIMKV